MYETLAEALNGLNARGFTTDFNILADRLYCPNSGAKLSPDEFEIVEFYVFEGAEDPDDQSIVYAIESKHGLKGVLVNAYGVYADDVAQTLIEKLTIHWKK